MDVHHSHTDLVTEIHCPMFMQHKYAVSLIVEIVVYSYDHYVWIVLRNNGVDAFFCVFFYFKTMILMELFHTESCLHLLHTNLCCCHNNDTSATFIRNPIAIPKTILPPTISLVMSTQIPLIIKPGDAEHCASLFKQVIHFIPRIVRRMLLHLR